MSRPSKPFTTPRRGDSKTFQITINCSSGLPWKICQEWRRRSFQDFPEDLIRFRNPKTKAAAEAGAFALVEYLKKRLGEGTAQRIRFDDITVGAWIEKFTAMETSPRTGFNASRNRPYSPDTLQTYRGYYDTHIKEDSFTKLKMTEVEEEDVTEYITRLSLKELLNGQLCGGTRTFAGVIIFMRMAFREYQRKNHRWLNPFQYIDPPIINNKVRDALPEDEMVKLFVPGVLKDTLELAVCAVMFLSGLRRSEIFALKSEDLDWHTPKITIRRAWQNFDLKDKVLGPPKGKKVREAPFDPVLQEAIKKLWAENGEHEFVFSRKDGSIPGSSWIYTRFPEWLKRAGIDLGGRKIVPHSSRHSLASLLEERGVSIRYIQELLGHSDLETTKGYLHSTEKTIRDIGKKITEARQQTQEPENKVVEFKIS
jgi:integrase